MGTLKDIVDLFTDSKEDIVGYVRTNMEKKRYSSISTLASEGILQFPVLGTRALDIETHQMIGKALERNYSTFVQVAISMNADMDISKTPSAREFVSMFHQNAEKKMFDLDDLSVFDEAYTAYSNDTVTFMSAVYEGSSGTIVAKNKEQLIDLMEHVRHDILNNKYQPKKDVIFNFKNKNMSAYHNSPVLEYTTNTYDEEMTVFTDKENYKQQLKFDQMRVDERIKRDIATANRQSQADIATANRQSQADIATQRAADARELERLKAEERRRDLVLNKNMLVDNDVKKSNELIPTTMHIVVKQTNERRENIGIKDFIIGIKATLHPIKADEMITNLVYACQNNNKTFNFLRWTTGEISFFRDFLFGIKQMKADVINRSRGASHWWITLKQRKTLAKVKDTLYMKNRLLPNATIVTSIDEVEFIKSEYGFDLMNLMFTKKVMNNFFLLGFVVVDPAAQMAHFLFDGRNDFETVSYSGLERENSSNERKFKEMLKVINRN